MNLPNRFKGQKVIAALKSRLFASDVGIADAGRLCTDPTLDTPTVNLKSRVNVGQLVTPTLNQHF